MLKPYNRAEVAFHLGENIGAGGNAHVFKAHDPQLSADLAIKMVPKCSLADISEYFNEASMLYLSSHTNVVPIHYACEDTDYIYLAMPYYKNGSLKALIASQFLTVREIVTYSTQFLSGLHHIHSNKLIHFDVKPPLCQYS